MNRRRSMLFFFAASILSLSLIVTGCAAPAAMSNAPMPAPTLAATTAPESQAGKMPDNNSGGLQATTEPAPGEGQYNPDLSDEWYAGDDSESNDVNVGGEGYNSTRENDFKNAVNNPLSTFSIDVDTASYTNIRRYIKDGQRPPQEAVRLEEMVNYFHYNYPKPSGQDPFAMHVEVFKCPWNRNNLLALVGVQGKDIDEESLPPANIVFLLDVSGSMQDDDKLPLLKSAFTMLTGEMRSKDRISIVTYSSNVNVVMEATPGNQKNTIMRALDSLESGGSTAGAAGLDMAYKVAQRNFIQNGNNRIILATDGDFNVGVDTEAGLQKLVEQKRSEGVFLSVMGFGTGNIQDNKMETMADKGNGNYFYIDSITEAYKVMSSEMKGNLYTIAKDVKLQIEFNPAMVSGYRLLGYENRVIKNKDFTNDKKDAGELGAGHTVTALYEIVPANASTEVGQTLKYQNVKINAYDEWMTVHLRFKKPTESVSSQLDAAIASSYYRSVPSTDAMFATAVVEWGLILKDSKYKGTASYDSVKHLGNMGKGDDEDGFRSEFLQLVDRASNMWY